MTGGEVNATDHARQAAMRGEWAAAFALLMRLDTEGRLHPADLETLAEVAYAAGHLDVTIAAWERAHSAYVDAGDQTGAAGSAARVAMHLLFDTALMAPVRGWLKRAERLLEGQDDSAAHAWLAVVRTYERLLSGDSETALRWAARGVEVGSKHDPAATAIGRVAEARLRVLDGEIDHGLALLEEVGIATLSGDLDPLTTGVVYCELVCALQGLAQYDLAEQWTDAMERWCETNAIGSLHGRCRVHRAEILKLRGRYEEAEEEAITACDELRPYLRRELGWPLSELGDIRLRRGDLAGAERALLAAHQAGWEPQPGLARVRLATHDVDVAAQSIRAALARPPLVPSKERPPNHSLYRAPLLTAQVEIEIAADNLDRARGAAAELEGIAERFQSRALVASAELARGRVQLAEGEPVDAVRHFAAAAQIWREIDAPYEIAIARFGLGEAHRAAGHEHEALLELEAATELLGEIQRSRGRSSDEDRPIDAELVSEFFREGDYWTVSFAGVTVRIRDLKGIHYLARLLGEPGREFHVLDLVMAEQSLPSRPDGPSGRAAATGVRGDAGEMLDDQARTSYRRRLAEIDEDIEEANTRGDSERAAQAQAERDFLVRELSRAFGLGGRQRKAGATSERARVAVTRAVRTAINRIAEHHEALGAHLSHAVRTGTYCSYSPDPRVPVEWRL